MSRTKEVEIELDAESAHATASISPFFARRKGLGRAPDPEYPSEVEDLYVRVVVCGQTIDITKLLDEKTKMRIEYELLVEAEESCQER